MGYLDPPEAQEARCRECGELFEEGDGEGGGTIDWDGDETGIRQICVCNACHDKYKAEQAEAEYLAEREAEERETAFLRLHGAFVRNIRNEREGVYKDGR